jgi:hypothetical protein
MRHLALLFLGIAVFFSACNNEGPEGPARGDVYRTNLLVSYSPAQVDSFKNALGQAALGAVTSNYGIDIYEVVYSTIDPDGGQTYSAGALVVPKGVNANIPLASYQHGTITEKADAPSSMGYEIIIGILLASNQGFAVCMPDYLGLSAAPETYSRIHPYVHAASQASASIDMVRASRNFIGASTYDQLNDQLFLFGYSQGGHATMATLKDMERLYPDEFDITACYPMAGPYDLGFTQAAVLESPNTYGAPYYLPFVLLGLNDVYDLYASPSDFLKSPYDSLLPPLYDGYHGPGSINAVMPDVPNQVVRDDVFQGFMANPNHPFRNALRDNDLYNFTPRAPMKLCHCSGDQLVAPANTDVALNSFAGLGRLDITKLDPGNIGHSDCAVPCLIDCLTWFSQLKE